MKIAKSTIILLVFVLMLSIFVANVADLINVDSHHSSEEAGENGGAGWPKPKHYNIGDSYDHLIWFLQVCRACIFCGIGTATWTVAVFDCVIVALWEYTKAVCVFR